MRKIMLVLLVVCMLGIMDSEAMALYFESVVQPGATSMDEPLFQWSHDLGAEFSYDPATDTIVLFYLGLITQDDEDGWWDSGRVEDGQLQSNTEYVDIIVNGVTIAWTELNTTTNIGGYQAWMLGPEVIDGGIFQVVLDKNINKTVYPYTDYGDFSIEYAKIAIIIDRREAAVPEPATMLLLGSGLAGLFAGRRMFMRQDG